MNVLAICAGVGGLELGLQLAHHHRGETVRGVCYVEREAGAAASLVASMEAGWLHHAPVWSDARTFDGSAWRGCVDIVTSGDPCQGNSVAGKRRGELDDRWLLDRAIDIFDASARRFWIPAFEGSDLNLAGWAKKVTGKIAMAVARISRGIQDELVLGNIDVHRDWGYAPDYVDAMIRIIGQAEGGDYIVATGESHSVREFVGEAFAHVGIRDWERLVRIDPALYRPADPQELVGDPSRLRAIGWVPTVGFTALVHTMVDAELAVLGSAS